MDAKLMESALEEIREYAVETVTADTVERLANVLSRRLHHIAEVADSALKRSQACSDEPPKWGCSGPPPFAMTADTAQFEAGMRKAEEAVAKFAECECGHVHYNWNCCPESNCPCLEFVERQSDAGVTEVKLKTDDAVVALVAIRDLSIAARVHDNLAERLERICVIAIEALVKERDCVKIRIGTFEATDNGLGRGPTLIDGQRIACKGFTVRCYMDEAPTITIEGFVPMRLKDGKMQVPTESATKRGREFL